MAVKESEPKSLESKAQNENRRIKKFPPFFVVSSMLLFVNLHLMHFINLQY